jgi:spore coat polysaccharide biosynthesis protein SpsF
MKVVAIVQARVASTRLPGKVLLDVAGEPMLARVVERCRRAATLHDVAVATSTRPADDAIARLCADRGWPCFRGSEDDVLDRYEGAASAFGADIVVRITGDCPLIEPAIIDRAVGEFLRGQPEVDYACTFLPAWTLPRGLDVEVLSRAALHRAWEEDRNPAWREHVTEYLLHHPERFRLHGVTSDRNDAHRRWTVDQSEDLAFVRQIYEHFGHDRFSWRDVLAVLDEHPAWAAINAGVKQKVVCGVLFRCDGSHSIGMGHVVRSSALAATLRRRGCDVRFAMRELPGSAGDFVRKAGFPVDVIDAPAAGTLLTEADAASTVTAARDFEARCVVVDHYGASPAYLAAMATDGRQVAVIDDLADRDLTAADWILNQNLSATDLTYRVRSDCVRLLEPHHALLRPEFGIVRGRLARTFRRDDHRVLLTFGGGHTEALCAEITSALSEVSGPLEIRRALGGEDAASMADLMAWADLSINGGGSTCWELCCLGVPMIVLTLTHDQVPNAAALARRGCAIGLGAWRAETGARTLARRVEELLAAPARREEMSRRAQALVDGAGAERAADSLLARVVR